ncbi:MAG: hypothetical protein ACI9HK_000666 [Pirellulaceae bacterium]|jgi:hypothetical protein
MKRTLLILAAIITISTTGCLRRQCNSCNGELGSNIQNRVHPQAPEFNQPGPPSAAVAYPYYTVRGPRDFFINDPPTIGR